MTDDEFERLTPDEKFRTLRSELRKLTKALSLSTGGLAHHIDRLKERAKKLEVRETKKWLRWSGADACHRMN